MPDEQYNAICDLLEYGLRMEKSLFDSFLEEMEQCADEFERNNVRIKYTYIIIKRIKKELEMMKDLIGVK